MRFRLTLMMITLVGLGVLVTSCAWGLVTDGETGQAVPGAKITFHDSDGKAATTFTDGGGLYAFDAAKGQSIPAVGPVTYTVTAPGYEALTVQRNVQYDDYNQGVWEVQNFILQLRRIVFSSDRDGDFDIYVMNADGSGQTNLTNSAGVDGLPAWSPDGSHIAFESDRDGDFDIYVMNSDGSGQTNLTNTVANDYDPDW